jgi:hypothetical protein
MDVFSEFDCGRTYAEVFVWDGWQTNTILFYGQGHVEKLRELRRIPLSIVTTLAPAATASA